MAENNSQKEKLIKEIDRLVQNPISIIPIEISDPVIEFAEDIEILFREQGGENSFIGMIPERLTFDLTDSVNNLVSHYFDRDKRDYDLIAKDCALIAVHALKISWATKKVKQLMDRINAENNSNKQE